MLPALNWANRDSRVSILCSSITSWELMPKHSSDNFRKYAFSTEFTKIKTFMGSTLSLNMLTVSSSLSFSSSSTLNSSMFLLDAVSSSSMQSMYSSVRVPSIHANLPTVCSVMVALNSSSWTSAGSNFCTVLNYCLWPYSTIKSASSITSVLQLLKSKSTLRRLFTRVAGVVIKMSILDLRAENSWMEASVLSRL